MSALSSCAVAKWTKTEKNLIEGSGQVMHVLSIDDAADTATLRAVSTDVPKKQLREELYSTLAEKMLSTVTDPSQDGVGIAAPQVGISRRIVAVMRFDKPGEPFEVYPNIRIVAMRDPMVAGPEGCLSVPNKRGEVLRSRDIDIQYTSTHSLKDTTETIKGFTAVIFQHECDHLEGKVYTDRIEN